MYMNIENIINEITKKVSMIVCYVKLKNSYNLTDINTLLETGFKEILNLIYGYNLENLNSDYLFPAIDLGDYEKKKAIQVTSTNDISKLRKTVQKFKSNNLNDSFDNLKIFILDQKKVYRPKVTFNETYFDINNDVISVYDLIGKIHNLDDELKHNINKILDDIIGPLDISNDYFSEGKEVSTIINIIELLSADSEEEEIQTDSIPDPSYKINERFKEYKEYLNDMYFELTAIYASTFQKVSAESNIGTTTTKKISAYLKNVSKRMLLEANGDVMEAYDNLVNMFESKLKIYKKQMYEKSALEYYIIKNIVGCSVFPNS